MEISIDTVNIEFDSYRIRYSNLECTFTTDKFLSKSILARVKMNKSFLEYLRHSIIDSIENMPLREFEKIRTDINNRVGRCYHHKGNVMKLMYHNETGKEDNKFKIYYTMVYDGFDVLIHTKEDLIQTAYKMTSKDISMA
jgi:hypothetical protein